MIAYRFPELSGADVKPLKREEQLGGCLADKSCSEGPLIWLQNRLIKSNQYYKPGKCENDFIEYVQVIGGRRFAFIARSKLFSQLPIHFVCPINKSTLQVTNFPISERPNESYR